MLPVELANLAPQIKIDGVELSLKSSFHVSLVSVKAIVSGYGDTIVNEEMIIKNFCDFVTTHNISFVGYRNEFRYAKDGERETVIAMCDVSNLDILFKYLNQKLKLGLEVPPSHVTLYTLQPDVGIGLTTKADLESKTRVVTELVSDDIKKVLSGPKWQGVALT